MISVSVPMAVLAARSWPDTPEEYLSSAIAVLCLIGFGALAMFCVFRFMAAWRKSYASRLARESEQFRTRWPADRLRNAPYPELAAEAQRCWQLALLIEERAGSGDRGNAALARAIAMRGQASSLADALNYAAGSGQR
ncbi:hypothetical protein [Mycobacterium sp. DBP42]|uniref:hypothetical protein n=1 Tax=Mycobacterium sp. DBP42 TaxID=2545267 RepID=UPI00110CECB0|nr:hypothetical protein [Mycobacterium sp. DBP42]TMS51340.1 hypothetical protein E0T84_19790 [Mycobacterium sp. DBP42]